MSNTPYDSSPGSNIADIRSSLRRLVALYVENAKLTAQIRSLIQKWRD